MACSCRVVFLGFGKIRPPPSAPRPGVKWKKKNPWMLHLGRILPWRLIFALFGTYWAYFTRKLRLRLKKLGPLFLYFFFFNSIMINRYFRLLISQKERIRICIALQCVFRGSRQVYGDWGNTTGREVKTRDHRQEGDSATLNTLMPYWPSFSQQWGLTKPHSTASSGAKKKTGPRFPEVLQLFSP